MAKKSVKKPAAITNRRAKFDYTLGDELVVGLALTGPETRATRDGHIQLKGSYVAIKDNELWLNNASFSLKLNQRGMAGVCSVDTSPRKLLAHRRQIDELAARRQQGMTIVPLRLLTAGRHIKLVIALGKGKKRYDKRAAIRQRDQEREIRRNANI
jgi:SsrA-binding protein